MAESTPSEVELLANKEYQYGFVTEVEQERIPKGLSEETVRLISAKKEEPEWLLEWRLKAYRRFLQMLEKDDEPTWAHVDYPKIDYQDMYYYAAPKPPQELESLDEIDPEIRATYDKLGIPIAEQERLAGVKVAVDAVFDSVSVATTYKAELEKQGILFGSFSEAVKEHPDLVRKYLGSVVPYSDNFFATLNSAVFSDGSFAYIPKPANFVVLAIDKMERSSRGDCWSFRSDKRQSIVGGPLFIIDQLSERQPTTQQFPHLRAVTPYHHA